MIVMGELAARTPTLARRPLRSQIYTIGYEGADIERFVRTLKIVGVEQLVDVRAVPLSRKKGFSKNCLRDRVEAEGIRYVHLSDGGKRISASRRATSG